MAGQVNDVTDETFEVEVLESETAVLVDFWAPWCGPCRVVSPVLEEINGERDDLRVVKLNVDENQVTAVRYEVLSIPTMILFKNGEVAKKLIGAQPKAAHRGGAGAGAGLDAGPIGGRSGGAGRAASGLRGMLPRNARGNRSEPTSPTGRWCSRRVLLVLGLLFRQLATLMLAVLMTVIIAIPLSAGATRLERRGIPRPVGRSLTLLAGLAVIAGIARADHPDVHRPDQRVRGPGPGRSSTTSSRPSATSPATGPSEVGDKVQDFLQRYTDKPERLIGPITSIGLNVAGVFGALLVILITAYYMAVRPQPLVDGALRLVPPARRAHARVVMDRLRWAWIGWMQGVAFDMCLSGTLLYIGLTIVGLDFAIVFAVITALLVVIPYYGAVIGAIPPVLYALTDLPRQGAGGADRVRARAADREQRDHPGGDVAHHAAAPGPDRDRRARRGTAVRHRRPVRRGPDHLGAS